MTPAGAKPVQQDRSRRTVEALLEAMDELLRSHSFAQLTIAMLAAKAEVSPASIYQRFNNRDALASILIELYARKVHEWTSANSLSLELEEASSLRSALEALGRRNWAMAEQLGYIIGPAYLQWELRPDLREQAWFDLKHKARAGFAGLLSLFPQELAGLDIDGAAEALSVFANMMLVARLLGWSEATSSTLPKNGEEYGEMIADFGCGYVRERIARGQSC